MASIPSNGYAEVMAGTNNYSGSNSYDGSCPRTAIPPVIGNDLCNKTYVDTVVGTGLTDKGSLLTGNGTTEVIFDQNPYQTALVTTTVYNWNSLVVGASKTFTTTFPTLIPLGSGITITYSGTDNIKGNVTAVVGNTITLTITSFSSAVYTNTTLWSAPGDFSLTPDNEALPDAQPLLGISPFPTTTSSIVITSGQTYIQSNPSQTVNVKIKSTISATTLGTSLPFSTVVEPVPVPASLVGFAFTDGVFVAQNDVIVAEFDSTTPPSFIGGTFWLNALNVNYYTGQLTGYTLAYSTGSIVIDDDICLIADALSSTGLAWGVINAAAVGAVTSVSGGTNIVMSGTVPAPVVNLRDPLTSRLNMGTQSLRDSAGSNGSAGQVLTAGASGSQTLWTAGGTVTDTNTNATYYPTFVAGSGTQALLADIATGPFSINPNNGNINLSDTIKINQTQVSLGKGAGTGANTGCVAIGQAAGPNQNVDAIAIGRGAGGGTQGVDSVAIGRAASSTNQGTGCVAIGLAAGQTTQGNNAVAIGGSAAQNVGQGQNCVAIGYSAGRGLAGGFQQANSVAIGAFAGEGNQAPRSIIINATGAALNNNFGNDCCFIKPLRGVAYGIGVSRVVYDAGTGELTYSTT